jgi:hypothetical protein
MNSEGVVFLRVILSDIIDGHLTGRVEGDCLFNSEVSRFTDIASINEISQILGIININMPGSLVRIVKNIQWHLNNTIFLIGDFNTSESQIIQSIIVLAFQTCLNGVIFQTEINFINL